MVCESIGKATRHYGKRQMADGKADNADDEDCSWEAVMAGSECAVFG
jgi:hypothetical protein